MWGKSKRSTIWDGGGGISSETITSLNFSYLMDFAVTEYFEDISGSEM